MLHAKWIALYPKEYTRKDNLVNTLDKQVPTRSVKIGDTVAVFTGGEYSPKQVWRK